MIRIKTIEGDEVRKIEIAKNGRDVRITMIKRPVCVEGIEDVKITSMAISKETYIKEMRKFLEELEA